MKRKNLTIKNAEEIRVRLEEEKDEKVKIKLIFFNLIANLEVALEKVCEICANSYINGILMDKVME